MKNTLLIFVILLIVFGCGGNRKKQLKVSTDLVEEVTPGPMLDSLILRGLNRQAYHLSFFRNEGVEIRKTCFPLITRLSGDDKILFGTDTIMSLTLYTCHLYDYDSLGYKGVIIVNDSINVAIFDKYNMGTDFYDESKIEIKPLSDYQCVPYPIAGGYTFPINNGKLRTWQANLDD